MTILNTGTKTYDLNGTPAACTSVTFIDSRKRTVEVVRTSSYINVRVNPKPRMIGKAFHSADALIAHYKAIRPEMIGRSSKALTGFALHGPTTGRQDEWGHPIRLDWVTDHPGRPTVVHGHVPVAAPAWRNGVLDIDTGCGMGGRLSALRWPEGEIVSVREA